MLLILSSFQLSLVDLRNYVILFLIFIRCFCCEWLVLSKMFVEVQELFFCQLIMIILLFLISHSLIQQFSQITILLYKVGLQFHGILEFLLLFPFSRFVLKAHQDFVKTTYLFEYWHQHFFQLDQLHLQFDISDASSNQNPHEQFFIEQLFNYELLQYWESLYALMIQYFDLTVLFSWIAHLQLTQGLSIYFINFQVRFIQIVLLRQLLKASLEHGLYLHFESCQIVHQFKFNNMYNKSVIYYNLMLLFKFKNIFGLRTNSIFYINKLRQFTTQKQKKLENQQDSKQNANKQKLGKSDESSQDNTKTISEPLSLQNAHMDLKLSALYQQVLQKQRIRMQRNQLNIEKMLERERERSDKRQQQMHQQITQFMKSLQTVIGVGGLMGLVYYLFTLVNQGGEAFEKLNKYWKINYQRFELIEKYSKNTEKLPPFFLYGSSVEKQLSKIQFDGIIGLSYLVGIPGSGKTTALKKVVHDIREKIKQGQSSLWSRVYYINLRVEDETGKLLLEKTRQRIDQMTHLLKAIFSSKYYYQRSLIVIDDIQVLDRVLPEKQKNQILESILLKCQMQECKIVAVSSSSWAYYRALENITFRKSAFLTQIQGLTKQQLHEAIKIRMNHQKDMHGITISEPIQKYLMKQYNSIKNIMNTVNYVVNQYRVSAWLSRSIDEKKLLQKIIQRENNRVWQMRIQMTKILRQKSAVLGVQPIAFLLKCILQLPEQVKLNQKFMVIQKIIDKYKNLNKHVDEVNNVIEELDRKNMLIFARPRSQIQRKAFQAILQGFK